MGGAFDDSEHEQAESREKQDQAGESDPRRPFALAFALELVKVSHLVHGWPNRLVHPVNPYRAFLRAVYSSVRTLGSEFNGRVGQGFPVELMGIRSVHAGSIARPRRIRIRQHASVGRQVNVPVTSRQA